MQSRFKLAAAAVSLALTGLTAHAATTNGFANGGFEVAGSGSAAASWLAAASGYSLSTDARSGSFSAMLASPAFDAAVMLQNSIEQGSLPSLTAGDVPELSFWAKGSAGTTGNVLFALRYLSGSGTILANSGNQFFQGAINQGAWTKITFNLGAVPVGAAAAFIEFSHGMGPIDAGNGLLPGSVLIDDLYLGVAAVPEPGTYALLLAGLAAVGAIARRRQA